MRLRYPIIWLGGTAGEPVLKITEEVDMPEKMEITIAEAWKILSALGIAASNADELLRAERDGHATIDAVDLREMNSSMADWRTVAARIRKKLSLVGPVR